MLFEVEGIVSIEIRVSGLCFILIKKEMWLNVKGLGERGRKRGR